MISVAHRVLSVEVETPSPSGGNYYVACKSLVKVCVFFFECFPLIFSMQLNDDAPRRIFEVSKYVTHNLVKPAICFRYLM
jgi:hypothetical protein